MLKEKGITLIALVITIIILLILAGISIAMLTGENGILTQAQNAKEETEQAKKDEMSDLDSMESLINEYTGDIDIPQVTDEKPGELEQENETTFVINSIEDLVVFSYNVRSGTKYEGQTVKLGVNLDFKSDKSYVDPDRTDYGIYGYNGNLKQLLTTGEGFIPIGSQDETNCFYGTFDGNNNAICSLYESINSDKDVKAGLFSVNYGKISNLGLVNVDITAEGKLTTSVGGIIGISYNDIYSCYVSGNIDVISSYWTLIGGVCGEVCEIANVERCYNLTNINGKNIKKETGGADISCGGIIGAGRKNVNVNECYNKGEILLKGGKNSIYLGGICGHIEEGYIKNSYNCGNLTEINGILEGENYSNIGGIAGSSKATSIRNCYNIGLIIQEAKANSITGGIVGRQFGEGELNNIFNIGVIDIKNTKIHSTGGILAFRGGNVSIDINNAYSTGKIRGENIFSEGDYIGAITGTIYSDEVMLDKCYYLKGIYSKGIGGEIQSEGVIELDDISKFPSVLSVVNGEGAFKEDVNNINGGYPILEWQ